jgi:hypothetical protein
MRAKAKTREADERRTDVFQKTFAVQRQWRAFHLEVTEALVAHGVKRGEETGVGSDRIGTCPAIDAAMRDAEFASSDYYGAPDFDRAEHLCRVVVRMLEREQPKFQSDPKRWLMLHWPELMPEPKAEPPRRRVECDEA